MKKEQETKKDYESPLTKETMVEMEGTLCGSEASIKPADKEPNVEVPDYIPIENMEVSFD